MERSFEYCYGGVAYRVVARSCSKSQRAQQNTVFFHHSVNSGNSRI